MLNTDYEQAFTYVSSLNIRLISCFFLCLLARGCTYPMYILLVYVRRGLA